MPLEGCSAPCGFQRSSWGGAERDSRRSTGTATSSARPALRLPPGLVSARLVARSRRRATCLPTYPRTYPPTRYGAAIARDALRWTRLEPLPEWVRGTSSAAAMADSFAQLKEV